MNQDPNELSTIGTLDILQKQTDELFVAISERLDAIPKVLPKEMKHVSDQLEFLEERIKSNSLFMRKR